MLMSPLAINISRCRIIKFFIFFLSVFVVLNNQLLAADLYQGPVFDAHAHLSKRDKPKQAYNHIVKVGFDKVALFVDVNRIDEVHTFSPDQFLLFVDPFDRKK